MLELLLSFVFWSVVAFCCSIVGYVFTSILLYEDVLNWYGRLLGKLPGWLGKPLGLCSICFTGQLALWIQIYYCHKIEDFANLIYFSYTISLAIFLANKYK